MENFVTRQPVFDSHIKITAYELLYRHGFADTFFDGYDRASSSVINTSFLSIGIEEITRNKKAIIKFTRNLLIHDIATLFPPSILTVELPNDLQIDQQVVDCCQQLRDKGYELIFDNFTLKDLNNPLLEYTQIIKININRISKKEKLEISQTFKKSDKKLFAGDITNIDDFNDVITKGFTYFQGDFFDKPFVYSSKEIPTNKLVYFRLIQTLNKANISFDEIETLIMQDISLTHKLLRLINSVYYGLTNRVKSVKQACLLLGIKEIRKWFSLVALAGIAEDKPEELIVKSVLRAKFCENMAPFFELESSRSELYMMGLFSLLDAILDKPMAVLLAQLPLPEDVNLAILGVKNRYREVLDIVLVYEKADWKIFSEYIKQRKLDEKKLLIFYQDSVKWTNQIL